MGNTSSMNSIPDIDGNSKRSISTGTIIGGVLLLVLLGFGIAVIVTSRKKNGPTNACTTLTAPTAVTLTSPVPGTINVSWKSVAGATSYNVYRSSTSIVTTSSYDEVQKVTNGTSINFTALTGASQTFIVTCVNSCGESAASSTSTLQMNCVLAAATNLSLASTAPDTAIASWDPVPYATGYKVLTLINNMENMANLPADMTHYAVSGSGTITIAVNAINMCAEGPIAYSSIIL
jgi:hypothetical protein